MKQFRSLTIDEADTFDPQVCIIGSGPAGTVLATDLSNAGVKVLLVESGTGLTQWLSDRRLRNLASYTFSGNTDYPLTRTKARLMGGNSNFWTGRSERLHPSDFEPHPYTPPENPWPIGYRDLAPFYDHAEQTLRVRGGARSQVAPPRGAAPPLLPPSPDITSLRNLLSPVDLPLDDSPTATPSKTFRFFNVQREVLPEADSRYLTLLKGFTVTRLESKAGRIVGARGRTLSGRQAVLRAETFVVACGGIESPRLLLLSSNGEYPDGIGNHSDLVGRGFNEHPSVNFYSRIRHGKNTIGLSNRVGRSHQYYTTFRPEGLGAALPVVRQAWILPHHVMPFRLRSLPGKFVNGISRVVWAPLYIGATIEQKILSTNRVTLSKERDLFGDPKAHLHFDYAPEDLRLLDKCRELCREILAQVGARDVVEAEVTWSRHHQGTCRMGRDPAYSVVDPNLKVHHTDNLYLCGCETFVTGGAMQPVLTIVALAHRLASTLSAGSA